MLGKGIFYNDRNYYYFLLTRNLKQYIILIRNKSQQGGQMTNRRNTIQKDLVRNAVYEMKRHVTANEVYEFIKEAYSTIGKGTVYRNLDILVEEGALRKVEVPDGPNRFDFTLKNHYHVRCVKCGAVSDVDMDEIPDLLERIHNTHGIEFLDYDISFKGICPKCREKVKEEKHGSKVLYM